MKKMIVELSVAVKVPVAIAMNEDSIADLKGSLNALGDKTMNLIFQQSDSLTHHGKLLPAVNKAISKWNRAILDDNELLHDFLWNWRFLRQSSTSKNNPVANLLGGGHLSKCLLSLRHRNYTKLIKHAALLVLFSGILRNPKTYFVSIFKKKRIDNTPKINISIGAWNAPSNTKEGKAIDEFISALKADYKNQQIFNLNFLQFNIFEYALNVYQK